MQSVDRKVGGKTSKVDMFRHFTHRQEAIPIMNMINEANPCMSTVVALRHLSLEVYVA